MSSSEIACFACDLKNDPKLISEYIDYHKKVWPQIIDDIRAQGIQSMQIFHAKGTKNNGARAMIVASKGLKISLIESLTTRDITSINVHNSDEEIIVCSAY